MLVPKLPRYASLNQKYCQQSEAEFTGGIFSLVPRLVNRSVLKVIECRATALEVVVAIYVSALEEGPCVAVNANLVGQEPSSMLF